MLWGWGRNTTEVMGVLLGDHVRKETRHTVEFFKHNHSCVSPSLSTLFHLCTLDISLTNMYLILTFSLNSRPINTIAYLTSPRRFRKDTSYLKYPVSDSWSSARDSRLYSVSHLRWHHHPINQASQIVKLAFDVSFFLTSPDSNVSSSPLNFTSEMPQMRVCFSHSTLTTFG